MVEVSALEEKLARRDNRRDSKHNTTPKKSDPKQRGSTRDLPVELDDEDSLFIPEDSPIDPTERRRAPSVKPEEPSKRKRKHQATVEEDDDTQSECDQPNKQESESDEDVVQKTNRKTKKSPKKRVRATTAREVREQRREREAARAKKHKPGDKSKNRSDGTFADEDGFFATASAEAKKKWRHSASERAADILMGLMGTNAIKDRAQQPEGLGTAASKSRNKEQVLADFIASMPVDVNKRKAGADKKEVRQASRNFGYGKVKAAGDGRWNFDGLKSTLYSHQLLGADFMVSKSWSTLDVTDMYRSNENADSMNRTAAYWPTQWD